jgi:hypothetical protein
MPTKTTRALTTKQLKLLETLYDYRFGTTDLLARSLGLKDGRYIHTRLDSLLKQGYIGRNYESTYKQRGLPAAYYLLSKSFPNLKKQDGIDPAVLKNIYKDRTASARFIAHNLAVFSTSDSLDMLYGNRLGFVTRTRLRMSRYPYLPYPIPDGFMSFKRNAGPRARSRYFLVLVMDDEIPLFVHTKNLKRYVDYIESGSWENATNVKLRGVLILCQSLNLLKRLRQKIARLIDDEEAPRFAFTTATALTRASQEDAAIWQLTSRPLEVLSLEDI